MEPNPPPPSYSSVFGESRQAPVSSTLDVEANETQEEAYCLQTFFISCLLIVITLVFATAFVSFSNMSLRMQAQGNLLTQLNTRQVALMERTAISSPTSNDNLTPEEEDRQLRRSLRLFMKNIKQKQSIHCKTHGDFVSCA